MPIFITPESGIPFPVDTTPEELQDFRAKAHALFETMQSVAPLPTAVTPEEKREAHRIMAEQSFNGAHLTAGTLANLEALLTEWDHEVLDVQRRLRNYVTNKLIIESTDEDPKVRLKALELLGKTSGVNAFSERIDLNVTHRTVTDIEAELRKTLELYTDYSVKEERSEPISVAKAIATLNVDSELGLEVPV